MTDKDGNLPAASVQDDSFDLLLKRAARAPDPSSRFILPLRVGQMLVGDRLRIMRAIGEGASGRVYEAYDQQRRSSVALKTLARVDAGDVYLLKNEFRALADLSHANLVRLHELFGEGEDWFFTMELLDGKPFDEWVRPRGAELSSAVDEARLRAALPQLCDAIIATHEAGKLHRDLKPSNVLVTREGRVVVLDFGLAIDPQPGGVGHTLQEAGVSGTPAYMAPEQAAGLRATAASDLYAFGVMLFEALTGTLPFVGRAHEMLVDKQRRAAPCLKGSSAPSDLATLCDALLARDPAERPNAQALRAQLGSSHIVTTGRKLAPEQSPLLGRESELAQLSAALTATRQGKPIVMFVSGESGIGKSSLCHAFLDELRAAGQAVVFSGRCHERESVPFKGIDSLIDDLSRFLRKLSSHEAAALMPREVYALARIFPTLGRIDAVARAPSKDIVDAQELRMRAFTAFCELLMRIHDRWPLVLYIDDAQWLDRDAATFLGFVLAQSEPVAALLLLSHRSEDPTVSTQLGTINQHLRDHVGWQRRDLVLGGMPAPALRELATSLLGVEHALLAREVVDESNGSPFFVAALSRHVRRWNAAAPPTLQQALLAQVNALEQSPRRLLAVLAVAARPLSHAVALDAGRANHADLDTLSAEHLLRSSGVGTELAFECYHDKIRESVAQTLDAETLCTLHASLLSALLAQPGADAEQLALHAEAAGDRIAAARYAEQAASHASESMAFGQAAAFYVRALELGNHAEQQRRDLLVRLSEALANAGRGAEAAREYLEAAQGADPEQALELKRHAAEQLLISGHVDAGKAQLAEVLRAIGLSLPSSVNAALLTLGWERARLRLRGLSFRKRTDEPSARERRELDVLWSAARGLQAVDLFTGAALCTRYVRLALDSGLADHAARAFATEAWFVATVPSAGSAQRAEMLLNRSAALAIDAGKPETTALVEVIRGVNAYARGDQRACKQMCEHAAEALRERCTGVSFELGLARQFGFFAAGDIGDCASAPAASALIDEAWRRGDLYAATACTGFSVLVRLIQGDVSGVQRHLEQARSHWPRPRQYSVADWCLLLARTWHAVYCGNARLGLEHLQSERPALEKDGFLRVPFIHAAFRFYRGGTALAVARQRGANASKLHALAREDARTLVGLRAPFARPFGHTLNAWLAIDDSDLERAVGHLRTAMVAFEAIGVQTYAAVLRRSLGQLIGGEDGAALVMQAADAARTMGAADFDAMTRGFMFGIEAGA